MIYYGVKHKEKGHLVCTGRNYTPAVYTSMSSAKALKSRQNNKEQYKIVEIYFEGSKDDGVELLADELRIFEIKELLVDELSYAYCDNCGSNNCEECNRKSQNWSLSEGTAEYLAVKILQIQKRNEGAK